MMCHYCAVRTLWGLPVVTVVSTWATAGQVTLRWEANVEPDLAGYIIYIGTCPGVYRKGLDVGLTASPEAPETTLVGLGTGYTYYFAVTAYDVSGNESDVSNEVGKTVVNTPGSRVGVPRACGRR